MENQGKKAPYSLMNVGELSRFEGKVFVKETLQTSGVELSLGSMQPGEATPFQHYHKQNEEV